MDAKSFGEVEVQLLSWTCQKGVSFEITHHGWRAIFKASELSRYAVLKKLGSTEALLMKTACNMRAIPNDEISLDIFRVDRFSKVYL